MSYNPYSYPAHAANERFARDPYVPPQSAGTQASQSVPEVQGMQGAQRYPDPGSSMAYQLGQTAFTNFIGQQNFSQFQEVSKATTSSLSHYFQVTTDYVLRKLKLILLPFYSKNTWQRLPGSQLQGPGSISFLPPKDDINSPDLYIPIMGLVTYILIWNVQRGLEGSFNPENLYYKLSSTLAFVVLDLVILKLGLYLLVSTSSPTSSFTELVCYVGYKFIPLTLVLLFPSKPWALSLIIKIYLFIAFGVFLLRSVKFNLFNASNDDMGSVKKSTVKKCNYFLFVYGFLWQSILMWLMG